MTKAFVILENNLSSSSYLNQQPPDGHLVISRINFLFFKFFYYIQHIKKPIYAKKTPENMSANPDWVGIPNYSNRRPE